MRCELRVNLGESLTKQTLPQIIFVGCWPLGTKENDPERSTIQLPGRRLDQEGEPKVFREAMRGQRGQEINDRSNCVMIGHKVVAIFTPDAVQRRPGDRAEYPRVQLRIFSPDRQAFPAKLRLPVQEPPLFRGRCGERQVPNHVGGSPQMRKTARWECLSENV